MVGLALKAARSQKGYVCDPEGILRSPSAKSERGAQQKRKLVPIRINNSLEVVGGSVSKARAIIENGVNRNNKPLSDHSRAFLSATQGKSVAGKCGTRRIGRTLS